METKFKPGDIAFYNECPPNWSKIREHCVWTNDTIAQAQENWPKQSSMVEIIEVYPYDEEDNEPEQYKIRFIDNPQLEKECGGFKYAHHSELS